MRIFKTIAWTAVLLAIVIGISSLMDYLLLPYQYADPKMYRLENETYDDLILGTSHGLNDIDPDVLSAATGHSTYNACMGGEYLIDSLYMLMQAVELGHKPGRVIYELDPTYLCIESGTDNTEAYLWRCFSPSKTKFSFFANVIGKQDFRYAFFLWTYYLNRINNITETVVGKSSQKAREHSLSVFSNEYTSFHENGFIAVNDDCGLDDTAAQLMSLSQEVRSDNLKVLEQLITYCQSNDIELVLVTTPVPDESLSDVDTYFRKVYAAVTTLTEKYDITFYDFNFGCREDIPADLNAESGFFHDMDGHMLASGAETFSRVLAAKLAEGEA